MFRMPMPRPGMLNACRLSYAPRLSTQPGMAQLIRPPENASKVFVKILFFSFISVMMEDIYTKLANTHIKETCETSKCTPSKRIVASEAC